MADKNNDFIELSKAKIQNTRNIVISKNLKGGFTLGQQIVVQEGRKQTLLFLKGSIQVDTLEGLYNIRDAINEALQKVEDNQEGMKDLDL